MNNSLTALLDPATAEPVPPPPVAGPQAPPDAPSLKVLNYATDLDASLRFVEANRDQVRFAPGIGWLVWDGRRWIPDASGKIIELAKEAARAWTNQARQVMDDSREKLVNAAKRHESAQRIRASVDLAQSDPRVSVLGSKLDSEPWLLNVENGTLNLRTGTLRPHDRRDLITKLAPVRFDPGAVHPVLNRYLGTLEKSHPGITAFLARACGIALTGDAAVESLFLVQGDGGSGKTTLIEASAAMLGDYARKLPFESLCQTKHGRSPGAASPDLMLLRGARLAYVSEGERTARLDAGIVKQLTGNEPVTARGLYGSFVTFPQTWKLWIVTNFDPRTDADDTGIWRRLIKIPFCAIPKAERDPTIKDALINDPKVHTALLAWAVKGCLDWQRRGGGRRGLEIPQSIEAVTEEYRKEQDPMAPWWEDLQSVATLDQSAFTPTAALREHYEQWCRKIGATPVHAQRFTSYLTGKGLHQGRTSSERGWRGISLPTNTS